MKFSKIYSNKIAQFHNIEFNEGLNVVQAEITDKSKTERDTHNLGKTLGSLVFPGVCILS